MTTLEYLGHIVTPQGIRVDPKKTDAIAKLAVPTTKKELQSFLGICNYYAKFVPRYAHIAAPLYQLLHKDCTWAWLTEQQQEFDTLKHALCEAPVLKLPNFN